MLFKKTSIIGIALAGIMVMGGTSAFATGGSLVTAVSGVDLNKILTNAKEGTLTVAKGVNLKADGTLARVSQTTTVVAVDGVDLNKILANAKKGTLTVAEGVTPLVTNGQTAKTTVTK